MKPHIRRFIAYHLEPPRKGEPFHALQVAIDLAKILPLRVVSVEPVEQRSKSLQRLEVTVLMSGHRDLDFLASTNWNAYAEQLYGQELYRWVRHHAVSRRRMSVQKAINAFREHYGITEDDQSYDTTLRQWHRLRGSNGHRKHQRGMIR